MDSTKALYKGIITKLRSTTAITDLVSAANIQNRIPQIDANVNNITLFPYIRVNISSEPLKTINKDEFNHRLTVQAWSRTNLIDAIDIRAAVFDALNRTFLELDAPFIHYVTRVSTLIDAFVEPDNKTFQSIIEFDIDIGT